MERTILRRAAMTATALTFTLATATASFASDCSSKTKQSAMNKTNQTAVMGATAYGSKGDYASSSTYGSGTIIDAAVATPDLSTLTAAVTAAGLVDTFGKLKVTTLSGAQLKVMKYGDTLKIKDENGNKSKVAIADIMKSNGTVHVISGVLLPKS